MAYIIPSDITQLALSGAHSLELETLAYLKKALPGDYTVFHGVHWSKDYAGGTSFGEIDFVIMRPKDRFTVLQQRVLDEPVASDHRPLFVDFIIHR